MTLEEKFDEEEVSRLHKKFNTYKAPILEYIFLKKFDESKFQKKIEFTYDDVVPTARNLGQHLKDDGEERTNWANIVKDLVRSGNHSPRSESAEDRNYKIIPGDKNSKVVGMFLHESEIDHPLSFECPEDATSEEVQVNLNGGAKRFAFNLIRDDEGGLLSVAEYASVFSIFFGVEEPNLKRVQTPVKKQPEIDGLYLLKKKGEVYLIPCEAKGQGTDVINHHQVVNSIETSFEVVEELGAPTLFEDDSSRNNIAGIKAVGAKILPDGDIYVVSFPAITPEQSNSVNDKIATAGPDRHVRYSLDPQPPAW
jgi:hypothetical protein